MDLEVACCEFRADIRSVTFWSAQLGTGKAPGDEEGVEQDCQVHGDFDWNSVVGAADDEAWAGLQRDTDFAFAAGVEGAQNKPDIAKAWEAALEIFNAPDAQPEADPGNTGSRVTADPLRAAFVPPLLQAAIVGEAPGLQAVPAGTGEPGAEPLPGPKSKRRQPKAHSLKRLTEQRKRVAAGRHPASGLAKPARTTRPQQRRAPGRGDNSRDRQPQGYLESLDANTN